MGKGLRLSSLSKNDIENACLKFQALQTGEKRTHIKLHYSPLYGTLFRYLYFS